MVKQVNDNEFKNEVLEENGVVLVDFWANWCGPCKMIAPIVEELSDELKEVKFVKVDVDKNPVVSNTLQIASIPTLMMFKNGQLVDKVVGFRPKTELQTIISKHI